MDKSNQETGGKIPKTVQNFIGINHQHCVQILIKPVDLR
jgi:hypothetical protein